MATTAQHIAKVLNAHHLKYMAGFYPASGGRAFAARVYKGMLQIRYGFSCTDWRTVSTELEYHDHNGRPIYCHPVKS